jgi:predicted dehydrogenase
MVRAMVRTSLAPVSPFSIGLIGAGSIARLHAEQARAVGTRVAGAYDVEPERARALTALHDGARPAASLAELLGRSDVDAVVVAAPNDVHGELALAAMRAGKAVLLEKPMATSLAECDDLVAAAAAPSARLQVNFVTRRAPAVEAVRRFIDAGRLGRIYHVRAQWYRRRGIPGLGGWFTTKARAGGGVLIDIGVHMIDLVLHLTGRPAAQRVSGACTSVFGRPIPAYTFTEMWAGPVRAEGTFDVEDGASAFVRFDGGLTMQIGVSWAANVVEADVPCAVTLLGEKAGVHFDPWGKTLTIAGEQDRAIVDVRPQLASGETWVSAWQRQHELFRDVARGARAPEATAAHGRAVQAIIDGIYRSSDAGREVEIDG